MKLLEILVLNLEKNLSEQFWIHDSNLYLPLYLFFVFLLKDVMTPVLTTTASLVASRAPHM